MLKSRQRMAVARKMKIGQREMSIGLGASGCSSMGLKMPESTCRLRSSAWVFIF